MAKMIQVTMEYEVPNSVTLKEERDRLADIARTFISFNCGEPVNITSLKGVKK